MQSGLKLVAGTVVAIAARLLYHEKPRSPDHMTNAAHISFLLDRNYHFAEDDRDKSLPAGNRLTFSAGHSILEIIVQTDTARFIEQAKHAMEIKQEVGITLSLLDTDKHPVPVHVCLHWLQAAGYFYCRITDRINRHAYEDGEAVDIIESLTSGVCTISEDWVVTGWNQAAEKLSGTAREMVIGKNFVEQLAAYTPPDVIKLARQSMQERVANSGDFLIAANNRWAEIQCIPFRRGINLFFHDITETKHLQQLSQLEKEMLESYTDDRIPLTALIRHLLDGLKAIHPGMLCSVLKVKHGRLHNWSSPHLPDEYNELVENTVIGPDEGSCGTAAYTLKKVVVTDTMKDPRWKKYRHWASRFNLGSCTSQPFFDVDKRLIGTFAIYSREAVQPNKYEIEAIDKAKDILERMIQKRLARENAARSNLSLKEAQAIAHLGSWEMDFSDGSSSWTDEMYRIFGLAIGEVAPVIPSLVSLLHPDDRESVVALLESRESMQKRRSAHFRIVRPNKEVRYVYSEWRYEFDHEGYGTHIFGILQDITDKKLAEAALKKSEEKYRLLFQASPLPLWVYDIHSYRFLDVNLAAIAHYGYTREEFLQMTIIDIRPETDKVGFMKIIDSLGEMKETRQGRYRHQKKDGNIIDVDIQGNRIDFDSKQARLVQATDITESLAHLRAIEKQNNQLREIAWTQSHIVRTPLSRIMSLIQLMDETCLTSEEQKTLFEYMHKSATELDDIIQSIVQRTAAV